jgi:hypothetical protein
MTKIEQRYNIAHYNKRIKQNRIIGSYLINEILKYKEKKLNWTEEDLNWLAYEDLWEIYIAAVAKKCRIDLGTGKDWSCEDWKVNPDGKVSIVRTNSYGKHYSAGITGCRNKEWIFALVYENIQQKFYFFSFPATLDEHTIPFDLETGNPKRVNRDGRNKMWAKYECKNIKEMIKSIQKTKR